MGGIEFNCVNVFTPDGTGLLMPEVSFTMEPGDSVVIKGNTKATAAIVSGYVVLQVLLAVVRHHCCVCLGNFGPFTYRRSNTNYRKTASSKEAQ